MSDPLVKGFACDVQTHEEFPIRVMNEQELRERLELNISNTTSKLRARVIAETAKDNGHGSMP